MRSDLKKLCTPSLQQRFPNFRVSQGLWWPHPRVSNMPNKFPGKVILLVWGPHFGNPSSRTVTLFYTF